MFYILRTNMVYEIEESLDIAAPDSMNFIFLKTINI